MHLRCALWRARTGRIWITTSSPGQPRELLSFLQILHQSSISWIHRSRRRVPFPLDHILFLHLLPYAVSRNLKSLAMKFDCRARLINIRNFRWRAPPRLAFAVYCYEKKRIPNRDIRAVERLVMRHESTQISAGRLLEGGFLRRHEEQRR